MTRFFWIFFLFFFAGCQKNTDVEGFSHKLVIDGWIEEGNVAYVLLTQNKLLISTIDSTTIADIVVRWAKVSVSDGVTTEVLSGRVDTNYFPPFVYRSSFMRGEAGKAYTLKVEYSGRTWTAETYIPKSVPLEKLSSLPMSNNDTLFNLEAVFDDPGEEKNYYKIFTKIEGKNKRHLPALMGNLNDNLFNGEKMTATVNQGIDQMQKKKFDPHFNRKDTVWVKFCTLPEEAFHFWTDYENELVNGQNPFFPANRNLRSNIKDGLGLWCGYGQKTYRTFYGQ